MMAKVDDRKCREVAAILKDLRFRPEYYKGEFRILDADPETKMRAYIYSTAICHQTHTLVSKRRNLVGWDYLKSVFTKLAKDNSNLLNPDYLATLKPKELSKMLAPLFPDDEDQKKCTLDRLDERSRFIIGISKLLNKKYGGKVSNLVKSSDGFLLNGGKGLYELLDDFECYADPLRKKSTVFMKLLVESGLLELKDPENTYR
jgi:hypothetical protein